MLVKVKRNILEPHRWFAWYFVLVSQKTDNGLVFSYVWLQYVDRVYVRTMGIGHWEHSIP